MGIKGQRCNVCEHPDRASIELGIANKFPVRVLGKRYGISADSVWRHGQKHMSPELRSQLMTRGRMTPQDLENLRVTESGLELTAYSLWLLSRGAGRNRTDE